MNDGGKTALVIGATSDMGRVIARRLAEVRVSPLDVTRAAPARESRC